jgi:hypothetical protein
MADMGPHYATHDTGRQQTRHQRALDLVAAAYAGNLIFSTGLCLVNAINWCRRDVSLLLLDNFRAMFPK